MRRSTQNPDVVGYALSGGEVEAYVSHVLEVVDRVWISSDDSDPTPPVEGKVTLARMPRCARTVALDVAGFLLHMRRDPHSWQGSWRGTAFCQFDKQGPSWPPSLDLVLTGAGQDSYASHPSAYPALPLLLDTFDRIDLRGVASERPIRDKTSDAGYPTKLVIFPRPAHWKTWVNRVLDADGERIYDNASPTSFSASLRSEEIAPRRRGSERALAAWITRELAKEYGGQPDA